MGNREESKQYEEFVFNSGNPMYFLFLKLDNDGFMLNFGHAI